MDFAQKSLRFRISETQFNPNENYTFWDASVKFQLIIDFCQFSLAASKRIYEKAPCQIGRQFSHSETKIEWKYL